MRLSVEIDAGSGFCNGVVRAVKRAEEYLNRTHSLYSLGAIVHNSLELNRLRAKGLEILDKEGFEKLRDTTLLIRAHGEPPETYALARQRNITVIDCTCPVVLQLQKKVRDSYESLKPSGGRIVIFGKRGHAEVNGLVGQTEGTAIVIGSVKELDEVDFSGPVALFSQTTKDPEEYSAVCREAVSRGKDVVFYDTICRQVASRHKSLVSFASRHSVILFVSGTDSSNGKVLFDLCRSVNSRSYRLENAEQIDFSLFREGDSVGICGATSTPLWQLEEIASALEKY